MEKKNFICAIVIIVVAVGFLGCMRKERQVTLTGIIKLELGHSKIGGIFYPDNYHQKEIIISYDAFSYSPQPEYNDRRVKIKGLLKDFGRECRRKQVCPKGEMLISIDSIELVE